MTEQHECEWKIIWDKGYVMCKNPGCNSWMAYLKAETRLNEYETLKKATEALSAENARDIVYGIEETLEGAKPRFEEGHVPALQAYADILEGKDG